MRNFRWFTAGSLVLLGLTPLASVTAAETATFLNAPARAVAPMPRLAAQFELNLHLPEGRGLARLLIDAGVANADAAAAARLAAGHLGSGSGGCFATVSIERSQNGEFSLVRVMLMTDADRTVIERRGDELAIASQTAIKQQPRLV